MVKFKLPAIQLMLGACAIFSGQTAAELVPYSDGLTLNLLSRYNSFLQTGLRHGAVTVKTDPVAQTEAKVATAARSHARAFGITSPTNMTSPINMTSLTSSASLSENSSEFPNIPNSSTNFMLCRKLAQSLDVSAAASIEYGFVEASAEAKYLNRFEESFLTYVVKIDAQRQPEISECSKFNWDDVPNPQATFGDRYISGVSSQEERFTLACRSSQKIFACKRILPPRELPNKCDHMSLTYRVSLSASLAFSAFKAEGKASAEVQKAMEDVQKNSEITTNIVWIGAPPEIQESLFAQADLPDLLQLKEKAEKFASLAKDHDWRRLSVCLQKVLRSSLLTEHSAVVEKYENCPNWRGQFQPLEYSRAKGEVSFD
ncbi:hypothetical protein VFPBJ_11405 [Purpureocillium lilacinum]|uniref:Uncharacterized protein n=1 Tax=Purpureocillium lilacinum TaxID=33203 RepID=A0A179FAQ3_PURLI|nr:hypothetical protein VFPBJ_11405 [Purpureocillium lilacinum]